MTELDSPSTPSPQSEQPSSLSSGQWFILAMLVLLNVAVAVLLILALTGSLAL